MKIKNIKWIVIILLLFIASGSIFFYLKVAKPKENITKEVSKENLHKEQVTSKDKDKEYTDCMNKPYKSELIDKEFNELFASYKQENLGIYFTEINNNYEYHLDENKAFYSGCTIKLFDAIYYIDKVRSREFNGKETITYLPQDKNVFSDYMDKYNFYDKVPVTKLLEYMMTISDNTSHFMFIREYGANNINQYIKEKYNIQLHFTNTHPFESNYTAKMADESLRVLYEILKVDDEYSKIIKDAMNNEEVNALNFDDMKFLHKYGELVPYHNDIGIYDSKNPYLISILTTYANDDYMKLISDIHKDIYKIYAKNLEEKEKYCKMVYEN